MITILYLDDSPYRLDAWRSICSWSILVSTAKQCINQLKNKEFDVISLDHDLEGKQMLPEHPNTGSEVVRWIIEKRPPIKLIVLHNSRANRRKTMKRDLERAGYKVMEGWAKAKEYPSFAKLFWQKITKELGNES